MTIAEKHSSEIIRLYCEEKLSAKTIAKRIGCSFTTIFHFITKKSLKKEREQKRTEEIIRLYCDEKLTSREIKKIIGCAESTVHLTLREKGLIRPPKRITEEEKRQIIELSNDPYVSIVMMSEKLNLAQCTIQKFLKKQGIKPRKPLRANPDAEFSLTGINHGEFRKFFKENDPTCREAAKHFKAHDQTIQDIAKRLNITISKKNAHYNTEYFKEINTPEKAYILGLFASDGNNRSNRFGISLRDYDRELLEKVVKELSPDKELTYTESNKMVMMGIYNTEMTKDLTSLGLPPNKTFQLQPQEWLRGEFSAAAILGWHDGDGSLSKSKSRENWTFHFTGVRDICDCMKEIIERELGIHVTLHTKKKYRNDPAKTITQLIVGGNRQVKKLMDWLYGSGTTIFMKRKHDIYLDLVNYLDTRQKLLDSASEDVKMQREKDRKRYENKKEKARLKPLN